MDDNMYDWKFNLDIDEFVESDDFSTDNLMDSYIKLQLKSILEHVILTSKNKEIYIDGFRYVKDRNREECTVSIFD